ncbi:MAG: hypothetical protein ACI9C4_000160 [Paraglaciecola sp.]|jgi:hypothetical protein
MQNVIQIRSAATRNVLTSLLCSAAGFLVSVAIFNWLPERFFLLGVFATSASIVALMIAWFKFREPAFSIEISRDCLRYLHRRGHWQVGWDNIQRIDVPKAQRNMELEDLSLVGIKLKDYAPFLSSTPLRLMTNILMEQRPLLLLGDQQKSATGSSFSSDFIEDDTYKYPDGTVIKGIPAMLANRMNKLRQRLGYDLYISSSELDRTEQEFVQLLRECQQHAVNTST